MDKKTTATIRERGQLTIPAEVRKQAQLDEGAIVEFGVRGDGVLLRPRLVIADLDLDEFRIARLEDLAIRHCSWFASAAGRCGDEKRQRDRRKHGSGEARAESKTKGRMRSFHRMDSTRTFRDWFRGAGANCGEVTRGAIAASMRA